MVLVRNRGIVLGYVSPKYQMYTMSDQGRRRIRDLSARRKSLRSPTNNIAVLLRPPRKELGPVRLVDDLKVFEATEGSTDSSPLLYGVETVLWPRAAKNSGNRHRGSVDAANRIMTRWRTGEAEKICQRLTAEAAKGSNQGRGEGGGRQPYWYSCCCCCCRLVQKWSGRSCGKVPLQLIKFGVCYSPEPSTASDSFSFARFRWVQWGGARKRQ